MTNELLRETANFVATRSVRGVRIAVKLPGHHPKSRVVRLRTYEAMRGMSDSEFDGTAIMDLGIGAFAKP